MKKVLLLILMAILSAGTARSQVLIALIFGDRLNTPNIEFGLNVGSNFSTLTHHPDAGYTAGLNLGLYFNFKLTEHFYLHPELMVLNQMGTRGINVAAVPDMTWLEESLTTKRSLNYVTLVFLPRYKLTNHLYFEAGLRGSFLTKASEYFHIQPDETSDLVLKENILKEIIRFDVGADVGLGFKFGKGEGVNLSLRFSQGFINTFRDESLTAQYNRSFHVQVGIPIGVGKEDVRQKLDR